MSGDLSRAVAAQSDRLLRRIAELGEQLQQAKDDRDVWRGTYDATWDQLRIALRERDEARAEVAAVGAALGGSLVRVQRDDARQALERVATERDEARAEVAKLGKEGEEHRRTIRLLQNRIQEANGITPALAEVFGCPTCRTILNAEAAGGCKDEWHHANRQSAATDRLRAALDEVRIEPEEISEERIQRVIAAAGLGEKRIEPPHARFHAFVASGYDASLCRCGGTRGEHIGGRIEGERS